MLFIYLFQDDADTYILSKISDIIHSIFGTHQEEFLPLFEQLLPMFVKLEYQVYKSLDYQYFIYMGVHRFKINVISIDFILGSHNIPSTTISSACIVM
jgi:hypothetical protein